MVQIDISMPASCDDCPFLLVDYKTNVPDCDLMEDLPNCPEYDVYTPMGQRDKNCPLREVPKQIWLEKDGTLQVLTDENLDDVKRVLVTQKGSIYGSLFYPERPNGTWRHYEGEITCSECGSIFYDEIMDLCDSYVPKFCPDCGAVMSGEEWRR